MPTLISEKNISADKHLVFDLARSVEMHEISTQHTCAKAVDGLTSGLAEIGDTVTWRAKHFGIYQKLTTELTQLEKPHYFVEVMVRGIFKKFQHEYSFEEQGGKTLMTDVFSFESPLGILGKIADILVLESYMKTLLDTRNEAIKAFAESGRWKEVLPGKDFPHL